MLFQLDILTCLCFDSNGYSESVKGQVVFQRVRTPIHLFLNTFLASCERSLFFELFPNPGLFQFGIVYPVGVWDEEVERQKGRFHVFC